MEVTANLDGEREEFGWFCVDVRMNLCCGAFFGREGFSTIVLPLPMWLIAMWRERTMVELEENFRCLPEKLAFKHFWPLPSPFFFRVLLVGLVEGVDNVEMTPSSDGHTTVACIWRSTADAAVVVIAGTAVTNNVDVVLVWFWVRRLNGWYCGCGRLADASPLVDVRHLVREQLQSAAQVPLLSVQALPGCQTLSVPVFQVLDEVLGLVKKSKCCVSWAITADRYYIFQILKATSQMGSPVLLKFVMGWPVPLRLFGVLIQSCGVFGGCVLVKILLPGARQCRCVPVFRLSLPSVQVLGSLE